MVTNLSRSFYVEDSLVKASNVLDDDAIPDKYAFIRDAWKLRREFLIYDGNPPEDVFTEDELFNDEDLFNDDDLMLENAPENDSGNKNLSDDDPLHEESLNNTMEIEFNTPASSSPAEQQKE